MTELLPSLMTDIINSAPEDQKVSKTMSEESLSEHACASVGFQKTTAFLPKYGDATFLYVFLSDSYDLRMSILGENPETP